MKNILISVLLCIAINAVKAQETRYTVSDNPWNADSLGNHRAIVQFNGTGNTARVVILWRRRDVNPQNKRIIVEDVHTHQKVLNVKAGEINNERGEIFFEPVSGRGIYNIYYMPYRNEGRSNYPKGVYLTPENTASADWLKNIPAKFPVNAIVKEVESVDSFNSFYPMEVIATSKETTAIIQKNKGKKYIVFPEDRMHPVIMKDHLPYRWVKNETNNIFKGEAAKGEYYAFQLGIFALQSLENVTVNFTDLKDEKGAVISASALTCLNTNGTQYDGTALKKQVNIPGKEIQSLWCGVDVPLKTASGIYKGKAIINAQESAPVSIAIVLTVNNSTLPDGGINEPQKQTRLKWLNSTLAQENTVIAPYIPLQVQGNSISLLGRKIELSADGFPSQLQSFFTPEMTALQREPNNLLAAPVHFNIVSKTNEPVTQWKQSGIEFTTQNAGTVQWKTSNASDALNMQVTGLLEFDGFISYNVKLIALQDAALKEISLQIPFNKQSATYMMGLGQKGGFRPADFAWKWNVATKNQDGAWIGDVNIGLQYSLRDEKYIRPLNTNFYLQKPLLLPSSWGNNNKGGIIIKEEGDQVIADNYSGERTMKKGDTLFYNFTLLLTPFHTINTDFQWATRFYHKYDSIDTVKAAGATVINIHHATPINPWINYPFIEWKKMKAYIDEAHANGLKVKIYNTVRELSNRAYETFPMRSLGHEIYSTGKGGGFSWLQEHINDDYIAAWFVPGIKDAAIVNSGMSRWHNYYVEGMNWLTQNVGIDGIYLDDVAFDRITMKRIKRVLTRDGHPGIIDLHSANQYNKSDGFNNSANLYMEHFPYLNRLWFGEYFDYENNDPDFFLTEVSGIPFGLMGEMLEKGGNPWRGMIYGMTNRMPWSDGADPRPIWKIWDEFGMEGSSMIGYWSKNCPVKTTSQKVLATVYKKQKNALVSVASWAPENINIQLQIDWNKLGIDSSKATITAPEVKNFQHAGMFKPGDQLTIEKGKGLLLIIKEN